MKWEYKVIAESIDPATAEIEKKLNLLGSEGWELVESLPRKSFSNNGYAAFILKRPAR